MPEQVTHNTVNDAALESVAAEVKLKDKSKQASAGSGADKKVADLELQIREANERALRANAELENYRKRAQRELADERRYAVVPFARDLLPVVDNLERAMEAAQKSPDSSGLLDGVKMIATQLDGVLKAHQCVRIETVGTRFDPNLHQAIAQEPSDEHPAGTVT